MVSLALPYLQRCIVMLTRHQDNEKIEVVAPGNSGNVINKLYSAVCIMYEIDSCIIFLLFSMICKPTIMDRLNKQVERTVITFSI